jgi:hypothetical protein
MVHAVCNACGWSLRFQGKHDAELFASDYHAEDRPDHQFDGTVRLFTEEVEVQPRTVSKPKGRP